MPFIPNVYSERVFIGEPSRIVLLEGGPAAENEAALTQLDVAEPANTRRSRTGGPVAGVKPSTQPQLRRPLERNALPGTEHPPHLIALQLMLLWVWIDRITYVVGAVSAPQSVHRPRCPNPDLCRNCFQDLSRWKLAVPASCDYTEAVTGRPAGSRREVGCDDGGTSQAGCYARPPSICSASAPQDRP